MIALQPGDVLMTEGGDLDKLGRGFLWSGQIEGCLHQNHIFALRCIRYKLIPRFLTYVTASQIATLTAYRKSLIHECVTGQRRITRPT